MAWVCGIYKDRPELCKKYPVAESYVPPSCGFFFDGAGWRHGRCLPECEASCCKLPREKGEPGGAPIPEISGGLPCRHLVETEKDVEFSGSEPVAVEGVPSDQPDDVRDQE